MSDNNEHINDFDQNFKNRFENQGVPPPDEAWMQLESEFSNLEDESFDEQVREKVTQDVNPPTTLWRKIDRATRESSGDLRGAYWITAGVIVGLALTYLFVENFNRDIDYSNPIATNQVSEKPTKAQSALKEIVKVKFEDQKEIITQTDDNQSSYSKHSSSNQIEVNQDGGKQNSFTAIGSNEKREKSIVKPVKVKSENLTEKPDNEEVDTQAKTELSAKNLEPKSNTQPSKESILIDAPINDKPVAKSEGQNTLISQTNTKRDTVTQPNVTASVTPNEAHIKTPFNQPEEPTSIITTTKSSETPEATPTISNGEKAINKPNNTTNTEEGNNKSSSQTSFTNDSANANNKTGNVAEANSDSSGNNILNNDTIKIVNDTVPNSINVSPLIASKKTKKKKHQNDSTKKWMITAYALREIQNQRVTKSGANNHLFDSLLTSNVSWMFELGASYTFKNQFQIGLGFSMNKYSYDYSKSALGFKNSLPINSTYSETAFHIDGLFGSTQTVDLAEIQMVPEGADLGEILNNKEILYSEKLDYNLVNIPFDLKWVPGTQRIKPVIKLGGEFNIITNSSSAVTITFFQESTAVANHAQLRGINFSGSFGLGTQINLIKGLGITLLPSLNYQSTGISKNSTFQFTPYSIRLYSGFYYKF